MVSEGDTALERFRAATGTPGKRRKKRPWRPPVPRRQKAVVGGVLLWCAVTLFWFRGGLELEGHLLCAVLGLLVFLSLFLPLGGDRDLEPADGTPRAHARRLLRLPVFWLGLVVVLYGLIQTLNPAHELRVLEGRGGQMVEVPHVEWLPSGVRLPLDFTNSPRAGLLQLALPWLLACAVMVGVRSRRALEWLVHGALAILFAWTAMALAYYYAGAESIYWGIEMGRNNVPPFWGTIKDPNHGAILAVFGQLLALGLAGRGFRRSLLQGRLGGIQLFYLALALFFSLATLQSLSRAGILLMVLVWLGALVAGAVLARKHKSGLLLGLLGGFFALLLGIGAVVVALNIEGQGKGNPVVQTIQVTIKQLNQLQAGETADRREILNRVSARMVAAEPIFGTGVGSWSVLYRQHTDPLADWELLVAHTRPARDAEGRVRRTDRGEVIRTIVPMHFDHAHNEYLQYLAELGVVGSLPLAALVLWIPGVLLVGWRRTGFLGLAALGATAVILLHSIIEFPTRSPGLGLLFALLLATGWLERSLRKGREA